MKREVVETGDGSKTIRIIDLEESYHSTHGALQEAIHVFIENGLKHTHLKQLNIFEMGFGSGLNAFLTAVNSKDLNIKTFYHGIEAYPVNSDEINALDYENLLDGEHFNLYRQIQESEWEGSAYINEFFSVKKTNSKIELIDLENEFYDIIYFDAFGPRAQIEMWSVEIFAKMFKCLKAGGFLVTYCANGQVKRNMKEVGFTIERLAGPPGKREMTRATKPII